MSEKVPRTRIRRKSRRVIEPLSTLVFWAGNSGRHQADMCDVSMGGCYLNTSGQSDIGERIAVEIPAADKIVKFGGTVIPQARKFKGFGLRFTALSKEQEQIIARLLIQGVERKDRRG